MADDRVTIGGALSHAWALWSGAWRAIWRALALNSLVAATASTAVLADNPWLALGADVVGMLVQIVVAGAVYRIALADLHRDDPGFALGPSGLHWRGAEWRMLGATLLRALFMLIIALLALIALMALTFGLASARGVKIATEIPTEALQQQLGPTVMTLLGVAGLVAMAGLLWTQLRLALALPATVDRGRISVLSSWPLTRGLPLRLLAILVAIWLPLIVSGSLISSAVLAGVGGAPGAVPPGGALAVAVVVGILFGGVGYPMTDAALAHVYRAVRDRAAAP